MAYNLFTDEATFTLNGITNTRNCHNWAQDNLYSTVEKNSKHDSPWRFGVALITIC